MALHYARLHSGEMLKPEEMESDIDDELDDLDDSPAEADPPSPISLPVKAGSGAGCDPTALLPHSPMGAGLQRGPPPAAHASPFPLTSFPPYLVNPLLSLFPTSAIANLPPAAHTRITSIERMKSMYNH